MSQNSHNYYAKTGFHPLGGVLFFILILLYTSLPAYTQTKDSVATSKKTFDPVHVTAHKYKNPAAAFSSVSVINKAKIINSPPYKQVKYSPTLPA